MTINPQPAKLESNFCDHIVNTFTIRWNGDVVPCCFDLINMMVMGNVVTEEIENIWNNEKYQKQVEHNRRVAPKGGRKPKTEETQTNPMGIIETQNIPSGSLTIETWRRNRHTSRMQKPFR